MNTAIRDSDAVIVTSIEADDVSIGDVVVFDNPATRGESIMHRVVGLEEQNGSPYVITKGDNNPAPDPFLTPAGKLLGKVSIVLPQAGFFLTFLQSRPGFILCVICPLSVLFLYLLAKCYLEGHQAGNSFLAMQIIPSS